MTRLDPARLASLRQTLRRIYEDGHEELLGWCQEFYLADNPEAEREYHEHNRAFYADVKRRGLLG